MTNSRTACVITDAVFIAMSKRAILQANVKRLPSLLTVGEKCGHCLQNRVNFHPLLFKDNIDAFLVTWYHTNRHCWYGFCLAEFSPRQRMAVGNNVFNCTLVLPINLTWNGVARTFLCVTVTLCVSTRRHNNILKGHNTNVKCQAASRTLAA